MSTSPFTELLRLKPFIVVAGPSGAGKTSLVHALSAGSYGHLHRPISYTTRQRREGEGDTEYNFINPSEFNDLRARHALLNQDIFGDHLYGISRESVADLHLNGIVPIKEMRLANSAALRREGMLILQVLIDTVTLHGDASIAEGGVGERLRRDKSHPDEKVDGLGLRLHRSEGTADMLAARVIAWLKAMQVFSLAFPEALVQADAVREINRDGYNAVAPEFTEEFRITTRYFHELTASFWRVLLSERMLPQKQYLEVGPGRGWLRSLGWPAGVAYRGLDFSDTMKDLNPDGLMIDIGSADCMEYPSKAFDGVLGSLIDPFLLPNFLLEVRRIVRPGGWFAGTIPAGEWASRLGRNSPTTEFLLKSSQKVSVASFCYTTEQLAEMLNAAGFDQVTITRHSATRNKQALPPAVQAVTANEGSSVPIVLSWTACSPEWRLSQGIANEV